MRPHRRILQCAGFVLVLVAAFGMWNGPAAAATNPVGVWTLSRDGGPQQCRLQLRDDILGAGKAVAMPPGCHRAFAVLNGVRSWVQSDESHIAFNNDGDAAVLLFEDDGSGRLHALGPEGADSYTLTPVGVRPKAAATPSIPSAAATEQVSAAASAPKPILPTVTAATVAGHYAVMRGSRDTGCMVTLDEPASRSATSLKARLAPACRDQGIMIFDPVGWQLKAGHLVLMARKGHSADFDRDETGMWVKGGAAAAPLGLKRL